MPKWAVQPNKHNGDHIFPDAAFAGVLKPQLTPASCLMDSGRSLSSTTPTRRFGSMFASSCIYCARLRRLSSESVNSTRSSTSSSGSCSWSTSSVVRSGFEPSLVSLEAASTKLNLSLLPRPSPFHICWSFWRVTPAFDVCGSSAPGISYCLITSPSSSSIMMVLPNW